MLVRSAMGRAAIPEAPDDELIGALYEALAEVTGARVLVDSSKLPPYGMLVTQLSRLDVRILHVVRDARATAYSWSRSKQAKTSRDDDALMPRQPLVKSTALWLTWNWVALLRWAGRAGYLRLRYEDFVADPQGSLQQVCELANLDPTDLPFLDDHRVDLEGGHVIAGNPDRHRHGAVAIREDDQWRRTMRSRDRLAVTLLASAGLIAFGYPLSVRNHRRPR